MNTLTINDETSAGEVLHQIALQFENEYITVRELITARITEEIRKYKHETINHKRRLVIPQGLENRLNNKSPKVIDIEKQSYVAFDAFEKNGFFILVDDEQVDELDQRFLIQDSTTVSFIKLTPLVGG